MAKTVFQYFWYFRVCTSSKWLYKECLDRIFPTFWMIRSIWDEYFLIFKMKEKFAKKHTIFSSPYKILVEGARNGFNGWNLANVYILGPWKCTKRLFIKIGDMTLFLGHFHVDVGLLHYCVQNYQFIFLSNPHDVLTGWILQNAFIGVVPLTSVKTS